MNYEEFKFTLDQSLPKDADAELIEKINSIKESGKVFFDYQDFYCEKHNVTKEVFDSTSKTKTQMWAIELIKGQDTLELSEDDFKEVIMNKMVEDVQTEGFDDVEGFRASLVIMTDFM